MCSPMGDIGTGRVKTSGGSASTPNLTVSTAVPKKDGYGSGIPKLSPLGLFGLSLERTGGPKTVSDLSKLWGL